MLTSVMPRVFRHRAGQPRSVSSASPVTTRAKNGATVWEPGGQYIPKTTEHLDAAKKFLAFVASPGGRGRRDTA